MKKDRYDNSSLEDYIKARKIARLLTEGLPAVDESLIDDDCIMKTLGELSDEKKLTAMISEFQSSESEKIVHTHHLKMILNKKIDEKRHNNVKWFSIAAAVIAISFLVYFVGDRTTIKNERVYVIDHSTPERVVNPTLVLDNGQSVDLSAIQKDTVYENIVLKNRQLTYVKQQDSVKIIYNTLIIPTACTYSLILSDSTEVFLNANSKLYYPNFFNKDSVRMVNLSGEGYFKVKKDGRPFVVRCDVGDIVVYGTEFNVNTYSKNTLTTTLISGVIGVDLPKSESRIMLNPNEILHFDTQTNTRTINNVDVNRYISWKRGYFRRDKESLLSLLDEISNWYNVKFSYTNSKLSDIRVSASLRMITELEQILESIEILADVKFIMREGGDYRIE